MANYGERTYRLDRPRLERGLIRGFHITDHGSLLAQEQCHDRQCLLAHVDSNMPDCPWGRLAFAAKLQGEMLLTVRVFASNDKQFVLNGELCEMDDFLLDESVELEKKRDLFAMANAIQVSAHQDILLYGQTGRYLWLWLELTGPGSAELSNLRLYTPGDIFLDTFPEVYRNSGDFLRRYLSVFSPLYQDLDEKIDRLAQIVDIGTAPDDVLLVLASWMGLSLEPGFLSPKEMRLLLKNAYGLLTKKGTREAIEGVVRLFVKEECFIVERNLLPPGQIQGMDSIYGETPYDFSILINAHPDEYLLAKLQMLVNQFKPVRVRANFIFLKGCNGLDAFTYLGVNSTVSGSGTGSLDQTSQLDGLTFLR